MKRKSLFISGAALIKWHAVIYVGFIIVLWSTLVDKFSYPIDPQILSTVYREILVSHMRTTIFWGLFFIFHFTIYQMRVWSQGLERQSHLKTVSEIQNRYRSHARLDSVGKGMDDEDIIDEEIPEAAYYETQRMKSR